MKKDYLSLLLCILLSALSLSGCGAAKNAEPEASADKPKADISRNVSFQDGFMDLSSDWYFSAYRGLRDSSSDLDQISSVTPDIYGTWNIVQPGLGWWTGDFDKSLGGNPNFAGYAWYVRTFIPEGNLPQGILKLSVGSFDEANEVYVNGELVGSTGMNYDEKGIGTYDGSNPWEEECIYDLDSSLITPEQENTIAVRMCNSSGGGGWYQGPIGIYSPEAYEETAALNGTRFLLNTYCSAALDNTEQTYRIYLPKNYEESGESYPVLYFLHGINSSGKSFEIDQLDRLLDEAMESGEIKPMIVVLPDDPTKNSFWLGKYSDMVAKDLVQEIDSNYRTMTDKNARFIGGCSMGGGGAFHIATTYPDTFSGIISFYGALNYVGAGQSVAALSDEQLSGMKIWMACGDQDMYGFYRDQEEMDKLLTKRGVPHYHEISAGEHSSSFYLPRFISAVQYIQNG